MEIQEIKITDIKPAEYNPRKIQADELDKLAQGIKEFGFVQPVILNRDGTIIGGHQRVKAAEKLGMESVPCLRVDISQDKEKALNISLNKIGGQWDQKLLDDLIIEIMDTTFELTGFDSGALQKITDRMDVQNLQTDIEAEREFTKANDLADNIIRQVTSHIMHISKNHPKELNNAVMIIVNKGPGNNVIFMMDPGTRDIVSELKRYAEVGMKSPLEVITGSTWK